jgi:arylsulfatase A-like enzyme
VLWIVTTQWRAQACGYAGDPNARTPALDALAAESVNYTQAVTPHPFGPFARAALLTGIPSPLNGVGDYFDPLPAGTRTVAHAMRELGYATAFFGKWHLGRRDPKSPLVGEAHARTYVPPELRGGFEVWDGFESGFLLNDPWFHGRASEEPRQERGYQSDVVCARAAAFLDEPAPVGSAGSEPRFTVVSLEAPHPPYDAPAAGVQSEDPARLVLPSNVPRGGDSEARARRELVGYYAHVTATDRAVGALLQRVPREDTIVVFTSVHGDMHGAHGLFRKGWPHEESVRVPLLVRKPRGSSPRRGVSETLVSLLDLPAWTVAWGGGLVLDETVPEREAQWLSMPSIVALPHQCDRRWRGLRDRQRKLVLNEDGSPWLFFDLERDPGEQRNLVGEPSHAAEIAARAKEVSAAEARLAQRRI